MCPFRRDVKNREKWTGKYLDPDGTEDERTGDSEEEGGTLHSLFRSRARIRIFFSIAASAARLTFSFISSKSRGSVSTTFLTGVYADSRKRGWKSRSSPSTTRTEAAGPFSTWPIGSIGTPTERTTAMTSSACSGGHDDEEGVEGDAEVVDLEGVEHGEHLRLDEFPEVRLVDDDPAVRGLGHLVNVAPQSAVGDVGHGVDMGEGRALQEGFAGLEEVEVDRLLDDCGVAEVQRCRGDGAAARARSHEEDVAGPRLLPGGEVVGDADRPDAPGHPVAEDHVPADAEGRTRDERNAHCLGDGGDACRVVEDLGHVAVVGHVDVGEEGDGFCAHHVGVTQGRPCHVESGEEGEVGEAGVHAVDGGDDVFPVCSNGPRVVHLVDADRYRRLSDDPRELPVSEKVAFAAGPDAELSHGDAGVLEGEEVAGEAGGIFHLFKDRPCEFFDIFRGSVCLDPEDLIFEGCNDVVFAPARREFSADKSLNIHRKRSTGSVLKAVMIVRAGDRARGFIFLECEGG